MPQAQLLARLRDQIYLCGIFKLQLFASGLARLETGKDSVTVAQHMATHGEATTSSPKRLGKGMERAGLSKGTDLEHLQDKSQNPNDKSWLHKKSKHMVDI